MLDSGVQFSLWCSTNNTHLSFIMNQFAKKNLEFLLNFSKYLPFSSISPPPNMINLTSLIFFLVQNQSWWYNYYHLYILVMGHVIVYRGLNGLFSNDTE